MNAEKKKKTPADYRITRADFEYFNQQVKASQLKAKLEMIAAYGGGCNCCGETNYKFLTMDHKNNDGKFDRTKGGYRRYIRAKREGYPNRYQVLCFNCNCGRALNGGACPHKDAK